MSFTSNFLEELEKKRKERLENAEKESQQKMLYRSKTATEEDIAPMSKPTTKTTSVNNGQLSVGRDLFKNEAEDGWFKSQEIEDAGDFFEVAGSSAADVGVGLGKGLMRFGEGLSDLLLYGVSGVSNLFGADEFADDVKAAAIMDTTGTAFGGIERGVDERSVFGEKSDNIAEGLGYVGGIILTGGAGQALGLTSAGVSALTTGTVFAGGMGSGMSEAYQGGATDGQAVAYGAMKGVVEAGTELLFGGLGKSVKALGLSRGIGGLDDIFAKTVSSKISNVFVRNVVQGTVKAGGEAAEEYLAGLGSAFAKWLTYRSDEELGQLIEDERLLDQAIDGFIISAISQAPSNIQSSVKGQDFVTGMTNNEQAVVNKEVEKLIAEKEAKGETVTGKDKTKIYDSVVKDLEKGYISTDTIEEVLGGEDYIKYQRETKRQQELDDELNELRNMKSGEMTDIQTERMTELKAMKPNTEMLNTLKFSIDENIRNGIKDSRLLESYNEVARRGEAFAADLSKYDAKQRATVQRAIDSGVLNNSNRAHDLVDMIAKLESDKDVKFDFANNAKLKESGFALDGKVINGLVTKDGITLNIDSHKALDTVAGHEITHVLEGTELYGELQKAIFDYAKAKGDYQGRLDTLTELYKGVKDADIDAELTADLVGDYLFTDTDFINKLSTEHRNVFQKIYDEIKYLYKIATAGSKEARELERVKRAFEKAYKEGGKASGDTKYSVSPEADKSYLDAVNRGDTETAQRMVDEVASAAGYTVKGLHATNADFTVFDINKTSEYNFHGKGIYFTNSQKDVENNYENYEGPDPWQKIEARAYELVDERYGISYEDTLTGDSEIIGKLNECFDEVIAEFNKTGRRITAYLRFENPLILEKGMTIPDDYSGYDGIIDKQVYENIGHSGMDANTVHYVVFNPHNIKSADAVTYDDKGNVIPLSERFNKDNPDIRYSLSEDSEGRKLTNNQLKYFEGSKVVDDSGKLKAVYHGSPADFNEFSLKYLGTNGTNEGYGFYFTDSKRIAEGYSKGREGQQDGKTGKLFEVYLDIKKPLSDTEVTMSRSQFKKLLTALNNRVDSDGERLDILSNYGDVEWEGLNKVLNYAMEIEYDGSDSDVSMIHSLINGCGDMTAVFDELRKVTGYDGIIVNEASWGGDQTIYIAFHPEQIKNVDNQNPTNNPDIRKSLSAEGDTSRRYGNIFGEDVRFNAPAAEDLTGTTETAEMTENTAPIQNVTEGENEVVADTENIAPAPEPSAEGLAEFATQARREELRGAYIEDGKQYISDGSFIAELNTVDESIEQSESFPAKRVKNELAEAFERQSGENYELDVAGIDDGYIKVGDSLFDSKYVNAVIRAIENPVFTLSNVRGGDKALLVSGDNGRAVLMPVRAGDNANVVYEARQVDDSVYEDALPSDPNLYDLYDEQKNLEKQIQEAMERYDETGDFGKGEELITRLGELSDRIKRMETEERALQKDRLDSLDDADAPPEMEAPYPGEDVAPVDPFTDRNMKEVSKDRKVKAYMYENPEVKPFFQEEANYLLGELERTEKPQTIYYGDVKYDMPYDVAKDIPDIHRTPRVATPSIVYLRDTVGMSYADIEKGLKAIIEDNGAENIAAAKKLEFHINDRLLYGYEADGYKMSPNQDYINLLNEKQITEYQEEAKKSFYESINATEVAPVIEKTPDKAYEAIRPPKQSNEPQMKRAEPRMKRVDSTKTAPDGMEERSWYQTSTGSEAVDNMVTPDDIPDDVRYYQVKSNEKTLATANARLAKDGYAKSREYFESRMSERKLSVEDIALGERLIQEAAKAGDAKAVRDLIIDVSIIGTELGQRVQALSMIRRLTPEGQLKALTRTVERGKAKGDKAFEGVEITQEMIDHILKTYGKDGTFDQTELNAAVEDVKQQIADQMSVGAMDYINAWRYLSMLGNPKTHIRNVVSNVAMLGTRTVKNAVARTAEDVFLRKKKPVLITDDIAPTIGDTARKGEVKGQQQMFSEAQPTRTKTWKRASDVVKDFAKQTTKEMESAIKGENKYSDEGGIKAKRNIFKTKAGNWMANANNTAMDFEDSIFSKQAFRQTLSEYLTANGIKTEADIKNNPALVEKAKDYALEEARKATFRQDSYLANKISEIERKNPFLGMAVGSIMPFKKTPINIAKTGLAYSPLGFARNIYDAVQVGKGKMDASEAIDHLAQTLTGTSLALIGYALAEAGILNGAGDDDKEGKYDYQLGEQSYSFNFGGDSYSLSWLSPIAMPLFVGANAYEQLVEGKEWNPDVVTEALAQTLDPLSEMSFISSLDDVLSSYDSGVAKIWGAGESMIQNYITQFVPTLSSQIAQTADDTKRSTKVAADSSFKFGEETLNKIKYKIPGLRNTLEPTTDIWGNEVKQSDNVLARGFEAFFSPANRKEDITTAVDEELKDLYGQTGDAGVMPSIPDNYINYDGNKYEMSARDYTEYKEAYGQTAFDLMEQLFDTETYKNADSETRADMVNRVYDYARDEARKGYFTKFGVDFTNAQEEGEEVYKENPIKGAIETDLPVDEYVFSKDYPERYAFFKNNGISYATYKAADEDGKRAYTWAAENPEKFTLSKAVADDVVEYRRYAGELYDIKADKDSSGKSIVGSRKEKVLDYINGLDIDYGARLILFKSEYKADDTYNYDIIDYLNGRDDISYEEMVTILKELDFTVDKYGNISWD